MQLDKLVLGNMAPDCADSSRAAEETRMSS